MKKMLKKIVLMSAMMIPFAAHSGPIEDFSSCLVEKTTSEDHLNLIKWMYVGMSGHPTLNNMSSVTDSDKDDTNKKMGVLFERLLVKDCVADFKEVYKQHGQAGIQAAFGILGEVAMAELMQNPAVTNDLMQFTEHVDMDAFEKALQ